MAALVATYEPPHIVMELSRSKDLVVLHLQDKRTGVFAMIWKVPAQAEYGNFLVATRTSRAS